MRVNLGCGDRYARGWVNVDHSGMPHRADIRLDLRNPLPWASGTLEKVYAGHLFEHLRVHEVITLLERLRPCVAEGGEMLVVGPDVDVALGMQVAGELDVTLDSLKYGADRWSGDVHRWEWSAPAQECLMRVTGWSDICQIPWHTVPDEWPIAERGPRWQRAVLARP
jgi:hypothetical protein